MNIETRIKKVISLQLNIEIENIKNDTLLVNDLGADSLDTIEIIMAMEDEFNISFTDGSIKITTVQEIIDYITPILKKIA